MVARRGAARAAPRRNSGQNQGPVRVIPDGPGARARALTRRLALLPSSISNAALADALGAEIACSRPLAEGTAWMTKDRYVGVSGMRVSPDVYVALGISGQVQHTSGMAGSKIVVAVNSDAEAPIFQISDYGIVGDIYDVVPALTAALS